MASRSGMTAVRGEGLKGTGSAPSSLRKDDLKDEVKRLTEEEAPRILRISRDLHRDPELGLQEVRAALRLTGELEEAGFEVETGTGGLATAFTAIFRSARPGPRIALLAEYDALPGLGHACGHNLIAAAAFGAAVTTAHLLDRLAGEVVVYGTPAEETIGGKVVLVERGAFDGIDAALMAHPGGEDRVDTHSLACQSIEVGFTGKAAHAVAHPEKGINALDALIQLFVALDALKKSLRPEVKMPGYIVHGGIRQNIVPDRAIARFSLRAADTAYLVGTVLERFRETVAGIAQVTRTGWSVQTIENLYDEMHTNQALAWVYRDNLERLGITAVDGPGEALASLDMGNVSQRVPAIHPVFSIVSPEVASHTEEFARAAAGPEGERALIRTIRAQVGTVVDLLTDPSLLDEVRAEHRTFQEEREAQQRGRPAFRRELVLA
jgi:amidohydrolase